MITIRLMSDRERERERLNENLKRKYILAFNWLIDNRIPFHPFLDKAMRKALTKRGVPFLDE